MLTSNNAAAAAGSAFVNQKLKVGDVVYRDYDGYVMSEGVFAQGEYNRDKLSALLPVRFLIPVTGVMTASIMTRHTLNQNHQLYRMECKRRFEL